MATIEPDFIDGTDHRESCCPRLIGECKQRQFDELAYVMAFGQTRIRQSIPVVSPDPPGTEIPTGPHIEI